MSDCLRLSLAGADHAGNVKHCKRLDNCCGLRCGFVCTGSKTGAMCS